MNTWCTYCAGILFWLGTGSLSAQWTDHFDDICGLSSWTDVQVEEGWNIQALETLDISVTNPGFLTMIPYTVTWYADYRGPLLFRQATNNFVFTGKIIASNRNENNIPGSAFSLGGLMVRNPKPFHNGAAGWVSGQEDYVFLSMGRGSTGHPSCPGCPAPHFEVKSTTNSNSVLNLSSIDTTAGDIRMVVLHPFVLVLYRLPGDNWVVHRRYFRPDLENTVQVGMVTYTDWDKASTYTMPFHNSHVLNDDLNPDPSNNPSLPFAPDIITQYDYAQLAATTMPAAWVGLDLTNPGQVSDAQILSFYGSAIATPVPSPNPIWLGGISQSWNTVGNWLSGALPTATDTVRINSCACPQAHQVTMPVGSTIVAGMSIMQGGLVTIPVGATLEITGTFSNHGSVVVFGQLIFHGSVNHPLTNYGMLDCRTGGNIHIED